MPDCALPDHLRSNGGQAIGTGRDLDNHAQKLWRAGWFAFGPRCGDGWTSLRIPIPFTSKAIPFLPVRRQWRAVPFLLVGYNVARWIKPPKDESEIFVGQLADRLAFYWTRRQFVEMVPGGVPFIISRKLPETIKQWRIVRLTDAEFTATEQKSEQETFDRGHLSTLDGYGPSPIQKLRFGWSWSLTWPLHFALSYRRKRKGRKDFVFFVRFGCRWDSFDEYFQAPAAFVGLSWN